MFKVERYDVIANIDKFIESFEITDGIMAQAQGRLWLLIHCLMSQMIVTIITHTNGETN